MGLTQVNTSSHLGQSYQVGRNKYTEVFLLLGLINLWGGHFVKIFLSFVKCSHDSRKKSDWFRCKKISQKLKYLNF